MLSTSRWTILEGQAMRLSGTVDAAVTWEPFLSKVADSGKGHILVTTKDYPETIVDVLIASPKLASDEAAIRQFMEGWLKSVNYIKSHPTEAAAIMAKGLNLPTEEVKGMMAGLRFADKDRNEYFFNSVRPSDTRIARLLDEAGSYWKSVGIVKEQIDGATLASGTACSYFKKK